MVNSWTKAARMLVETCHRSITTPAPISSASVRKRRRMGFAARKRIPERIIATTAMNRKLNRMSSFIRPLFREP